MMNFKKLHEKDHPTLICNVWDVPSAQIAQQLNYDAIGTSSGAIAAMLGYPDGEDISFDELEYIVSRISGSTDIPLSVDLEAGYSRKPDKIVEHIKRLEQLGVVGINIEDSIVNGTREILTPGEFTKLLAQLTNLLAQQHITTFINVRTDTFLLGLSNPLEQTIARGLLYKEAGADGLFVPCVEQAADIKEIIEQVNLPLNVMCMPNLPNFEVLQTLGVKRISMGNFVYNKLNNVLEEQLITIQHRNSFQSLFI